MGCSPWGREELDTTEQLHFHALEKEMATHSSVLAWRIPGMGEPSGLPSMGSDTTEATQQQQQQLYSKVTQFYTQALFKMIFHYGLSQEIGHSYLCYTVGPCLSFLNVTVCIYQPQISSLSLSLPFPTLATTSLISTSVSLFLFGRQVHLCYILNSTCK